jgi:CubicO group peptidase (beta-lactamase class C family)
MKSKAIGLLVLACAIIANGEEGAVTDNTSQALKSEAERRSEEAQDPTLAASSAFPNHDFEAWPAFIEKQFGTNMVGGYSFVVRQKGDIVASGVGGYARMPWEATGPGLRWTTARRMHIASASKPITAVAMLKLWEEHQKQFSLDDPFWPFVKHLFPDATPLSKTITIRHLLTHRSGLTKHGSNLTLADARIGLSDSKNQPPGTTRTYGGHNFLLLRFVIEAISGEPYTQYVVNHVLRPAGVLNMDTKPETDLPVLTYSGLKGQKGNPMGASGFVGGNWSGLGVIGMARHAGIGV